MNKAYRVVFNHATQTWTAVAEFAKAKGKTKSLKLSAVATAIAAATGVAGTAHAAKVDNTTIGTSLAPKTIVITDDAATTGVGELAKVTGSEGKAIRIGSGSPVREGSIVIGYDLIDASTGNGGDVAIGNHVRLGGGGQDSLSTVVGTYGQAAGPSVALGAFARADISATKGVLSVNEGATAIGAHSFTGGNIDGGTAVGVGAAVFAKYGIAIGAFAGQHSDRGHFKDLARKEFANFGEQAQEYTTSIGDRAGGRGKASIAIGSDVVTGARFGNAVTANSDFAVSMGNVSRAVTQASIAIGNNTQAGQYTEAQVALLQACLTTINATVDEFQAKVTAGEAANIHVSGNLTEKAQLSMDAANLQRAKVVQERLINDLAATRTGAARSDRAVAIGDLAKALGQNSVAVGVQNNVTGANSTAVGQKNVVSGNSSGAFGDPNYVAADGSYAIGNNNTINSIDTFVLGTGIGQNDAMTANLAGNTIANSVYLGKDSEAASGAVADPLTTQQGVSQLTGSRAGGNTQTAGTGEYKGSQLTTTYVNSTSKSASNYALGTKVDNFTYAKTGDPAQVQNNDYAGKDAVGVVTVGASEGGERRIVNVAAGLISEKSTDAINGSQMYAVMKQAAQPITFTGNQHLDTDGNGTEQILGTTLRITGALSEFNGARNQDARVDSTFSAKNVATVVSNGEVQIQIAENPEFKKVTLTEPLLGDSKASTIAQKPDDPEVLNKAASLGDVLNTGWHLQENGNAVDLVRPYDTVNFTSFAKDGTTPQGIEVTSDSDLETSNVRFKVLTDDTTIKINDDGKLEAIIPTPETASISYGSTAIDGQLIAGAGDGDKLANISTIVEAVNNTYWKIHTANNDEEEATVNDGMVHPSNNVTFRGVGAVTVSAGTRREQTQGNSIGAGDQVYDVNITVNVDEETITTVAEESQNEFGEPITINKLKAKTSTLTAAPTDDPAAPEAGTILAGDAPTALTTAQNVADMINAAAWKATSAATTAGTNEGTSVELVNAGDTVTFEADSGVKIVQDAGKFTFSVKTDGTTTEINENGEIVAKLPKTSDVTNVAEGQDNAGSVVAPNEEDGANLVNATTLAKAINDSGFTVTTDLAGGERKGAEATKELVKAGETVTFKAGTNLAIEQDGQNITYSTVMNPTFSNVTTGGDVTVNDDGSVTVTNPIFMGKTEDGKNAITGLNSTLPDFNTNPAETKAPTLNETQLGSAATLNDVLNAGWNLQNNDEAKDFVKPYDTVNFVDGVGTTAKVTMDGETLAKVQYDVKVDNTTTRINENGEIEAIQPVAGTFKADENGSLAPTAGDETKLASVKGVADAVNASYWNINTSQDGANEAKVGDGKVNPSNDVVINGTGAVKVTAGVSDENKYVIDVAVATDDSTVKIVDGKLTAVQPQTAVLSNATDGKVNPAEASPEAKKALEDAQAALAALPDTATEEEKKAAQDAVDAAQANIDNAGNALATAQNVADAINNSGFTLKTSANGGEKISGEDEVINPGDVIDMVAGKNLTVKQEENGKITYATAENVSFTEIKVAAPKEDGTAGDNPITIANNAITGLNSTLPALNTNPAETKAPTLNETQLGSAATLNDVLNAGWNLQNNDEAKDFVKPYDTVNFVDGVGTTAKVTMDGETLAKVQYDVKVDNTTTRINENGEIEAIQPTTSVDGNQVGGDVNFGDTATVNAATNEAGDIVFNVNTGEVTPVTEGDKAGSVTGPADNPALAEALKAAQDELAALPADATEEQKQAAADKVAAAQNAINNAGNVVATAQNVADAINASGFTLKTSANGGEKISGEAELINPADTVEMIAGKNLTVKQEADGKITYATAENVSFTEIKVAAPKEDGTAGDNPITIANNAITGLNSTLPETTSTGDAPTTAQAAPQNVDASKAATLGDVLNTGWNLQANNAAVDFVKPYDTVNFVDGKGTKVVASTDGSTSNVQIDVDVTQLSAPITNNADGSVTGPANAQDLQDAVTAAEEALAALPADATEEQKAAAEKAVQDAKDAVTNAGNQLATAQNVADAINASGWNATSGKVGTGEVEGTTNELINPSEIVTFQAGDNMMLKQEGNVFTYSVNPNPVFNNVTANQVTVGGTPATADTPAKAPIVIGTNPEGINEITGLDTTLPVPADSATKPADINENKAATLGDVLNAGWNLQGNSSPVDAVTPYDTVNFADGKGTKVVIDSKDGVNTIKVDFNPEDLVTNTTPNANGTVNAGSNPSQLVNASTVAQAINNSGFNLTSGQAGTGVVAGTTNERVNPGETVKLNAGNNMVLLQEGNNFTYSVSANPVFNSTTIGGSPANNNTPITIGTDDKGNNAIGGLTTTIATPTAPEAKKDTIANAPTTNAATLGDVLNAGWNLKENGVAKDVVTPYDTVNFVNGQATTVNVTTDGTTSNIKVDVNVDDKTIKVVDGKLTAVQPDTLVNGNKVGGDINLVDSDTVSVVAGDKAGDIKFNVNTGASEVAPTGTAAAKAGDENKVATVGDIVNTINGVGFNAAVAKTGTGESEDKGGDALVNAGDTLTVTAGDNIKVTKDGLNYTIETTKDVNFNNVTAAQANIGGDAATGKAPITIGTTPAANGQPAKNVIGNLDTTIAAPTTANNPADKPAGDALNNAATLGDVLNAGWNLQENGASKDVVTPYDTVNFANGSGTAVNITTDGATSVVKVDVKTANTDTVNLGVDAAGNLVANANTSPITNAANGSVNTPAAPNALATAGDVAKAINGSGFTLTAQGANGSIVNPGETVDMKNTDGNIAITKDAASNDVVYNLNPTINVTNVNAAGTVTAGNLTVQPNGNVNMGGNRIQNVAPGVADTDAVNVSQLKGAINNAIAPINNRLDDIDDNYRAGIAGSAALVNIPQVTRPGANLLGVGLGHFKGESAVAVGFSSASDNERLIFKISGSANTQGDYSIGSGMGWQW